MATPRKKSASKSKPVARPAKPTRPAKAKSGGKSAAAKSAKTAPVKGKAAKPAPAKKSAAKPAPAPVAKAPPKVVHKIRAVVANPKNMPARAGKTPGGRKGPAVPAEVRPLGVLPPSAVARATAKPAPAAPIRPRPVAAPAPRTSPAAEGAQRVTEKDLKVLETRLLEQRKLILKEMGHLENTVLKVNQRDSSGDLSGYSFHMADAGTDAMEREKAFLFASAEGRTLMEIDEALRRLYRGEYGVCESCNQPIARARLEAMPDARLCLSCKEKEEKAQRGAS